MTKQHVLIFSTTIYSTFMNRTLLAWKQPSWVETCCRNKVYNTNTLSLAVINSFITIKNVFYSQLNSRNWSGHPSWSFHNQIRLHTPQSVGLLWKRDRPIAETSTWQYRRQTFTPQAQFETAMPASDRTQANRWATGIGIVHVLEVQNV